MNALSSYILSAGSRPQTWLRNDIIPSTAFRTYSEVPMKCLYQLLRLQDVHIEDYLNAETSSTDWYRWITLSTSDTYYPSKNNGRNPSNAESGCLEESPYVHRSNKRHIATAEASKSGIARAPLTRNDLKERGGQCLQRHNVVEVDFTNADPFL